MHIPPTEEEVNSLLRKQRAEGNPSKMRELSKKLRDNADKWRRKMQMEQNFHRAVGDSNMERACTSMAEAIEARAAQLKGGL